MKLSNMITGPIFVFLLLFCTKEPTSPTAGGGTEVGNALVSGRLYASNGSPAKGAIVQFVKVGYDPYNKTTAKMLAEADTVITDTTGTYGTNDLDTGTYNVYVEDDNGDVVLIDSVEITEDTTVIDPDTLDEPGSVAGYIKLEPGDEPDKIIAVVLGSNTFRWINTNASFSLADMAEGLYNVRFFSTLDNYSNYDTVFSVTAGTDIDLGTDSIVIPLKIPKVTGLTVEYDTLKQIVTLFWDQADTTKIEGYNVYRRHVDSTDVKLNVQAITDTFYVDSTGVQDEIYIYSVVGVDLNDDEGIPVSGDSLMVSNGFNFIDTVSITIAAPPNLRTFDVSSSEDFHIPTGVDYGTRITVFSANGDSVNVFGDSVFSRVVGVNIDSKGNIYALDPGSDKIFKFN